jgi:hypothetical protein
MIEKLRKLHTEILSLKKKVSAISSERISQKEIRSMAETIGSTWFSDFSESLISQFGISPDIVESYSQNFGRLIKISGPNNHRKSYIEVLKNLLKSFRDELIIPIQTQPKDSVKISLLAKVLEGLSLPAENEYLKEAIECAHNNHYRAAVVMGWCASIDRIHRVIQKEGFTRFNVKSAEMASQQKGRFKRFNAVQNISSISELREVFDTIVLWILEGMEMIDSNQHTRLRSCFELRCQCAHPGDAPVTEYNMLSFFSDLKEIILQNEKFKIN